MQMESPHEKLLLVSVWRFPARHPVKGPIVVKRLLLGTALALPLLTAVPARATTISGNMTADNAFFAYLSTDDTQRGTLIGQGNDHGLTYQFSPTDNVPLIAGITYFLHTEIIGAGGYEGFAGNFLLTGSGFTFANGLTSFDTTSATSWRAGFISNFSDFNSPVEQPWVQPTGAAATYTGPNNSFPGTSWLWTSGGNAGSTGGMQTIGLSTTITATGVLTSSVPEPISAALLGAGLLGLVLVRRRSY